MKGFQVLCTLAEVNPSVDLFSHFYQIMQTKKKVASSKELVNERAPSTSRREDVKSWITIKPSSRTKFLKPYSDSYKTFKDSFVYIDFVAVEGRPFWLSEDNVIDPPVY